MWWLNNQIVTVLCFIGVVLGGLALFCIILYIGLHLYYCIKYQSWSGTCEVHKPKTEIVKYYKIPELFEPRTVMLRVKGEMETCSKCGMLLSKPKDIEVLNYYSSFSAPDDYWDEIAEKGFKILK